MLGRMLLVVTSTQAQQKINYAWCALEQPGSLATTHVQHMDT
jgi:hypothetical protein